MPTIRGVAVNVVYAIGTQVVTSADGTRVKVPKGSHWPADDPIVQARPDVFSTDPRWGMLYTVEPPGYDAPIETASAAPGERRSVRRA
jgi:hypothetical protein